MFKKNIAVVRPLLFPKSLVTKEALREVWDRQQRDIQAKEFQQALYQCLFKSYKNIY